MVAMVAMAATEVLWYNTAELSVIACTFYNNYSGPGGNGGQGGNGEDGQPGNDPGSGGNGGGDALMTAKTPVTLRRHS